MAGNTQLQKRAGFNYPDVFGLLSALRGNGVKLTSSTLKLLEGSDSEARVVGAVSLLTPGSFLEIFNYSGANVTAQLWLILADGSETQIGADLVVVPFVTSADIGELTPFSYILREGDRVELRFSAGNVTAQDGVRVAWGWTVLKRAYLQKLGYQKFTNTSLEISGSPGVAGVLSLALVNFSSEDIPYDMKRIWPDGFEEDVGSDVLKASGVANSAQLESTASIVNDDWKFRIELTSPLPASGFVWAQALIATPVNMAEQDW